MNFQTSISKQSFMQRQQSIGSPFTRQNQQMQQQLQKYPIKQMEDPLSIFNRISENNQLNIHFKKDNYEHMIIKFVILNLLDTISKDSKNTETSENISQLRFLVNNKTDKNTIFDYTKHVQIVAEISKQYNFTVPIDLIYLQKKGKLLKLSTLRMCYMTNESFGQMTQDKVQMLKSSQFKHQFVHVETKDEILTKGDKKGKKNWPTEKKLDGYNYRLSLLDTAKNQTKILYVHKLEDCLKIKYQIISCRTIHYKNPLQVFDKLILMWAVKQYQNFYYKYLVNFFLNNSYNFLAIQNDCLIEALTKAKNNENNSEITTEQNNQNYKTTFSINPKINQNTDFELLNKANDLTRKLNENQFQIQTGENVYYEDHVAKLQNQKSLSPLKYASTHPLSGLSKKITFQSTTNENITNNQHTPPQINNPTLPDHSFENIQQQQQDKNIQKNQIEPEKKNLLPNINSIQNFFQDPNNLTLQSVEEKELQNDFENENKQPQLQNQTMSKNTQNIFQKIQLKQKEKKHVNYNELIDITDQQPQSIQKSQKKEQIQISSQQPKEKEQIINQEQNSQTDQNNSSFQNDNALQTFTQQSLFKDDKNSTSEGIKFSFGEHLKLQLDQTIQGNSLSDIDNSLQLFYFPIFELLRQIYLQTHNSQNYINNSKITQIQKISQEQFLNNISANVIKKEFIFEPQQQQNNFTDSQIQFFNDNTKVFLQLSGLVLPKNIIKVSNQKQPNYLLILQTQFQNNLQQSQSLLFQHFDTSIATIFNISNNLILKFNNLKKLKIQLTEMATEKKIINTEINLLTLIKYIQFENEYYTTLKTKFDKKEHQFGLKWRFVICPKNLETAHLLMSKLQIKLLFEHFTPIYKSETIRKFNELTLNIENYPFKKHFFEQTFQKKEAHFISNDDFFNSNFSLLKLFQNIHNDSRNDNQNILNWLLDSNSSNSQINQFYQNIKNGLHPSQRITLYQVYASIIQFPFEWIFQRKKKKNFHKNTIKKAITNYEEYLKQQHNITQQEKELLFLLVIEVCIILEEEDQYFLYQHISMIKLIIQENSQYLEFEQMLIIILSLIMQAQAYNNNHTSLLQNGYDQYTLLLLLFKQESLSTYENILAFIARAEQLTIGGFQNSFSDYMDPRSYQQYQDMKVATELTIILGKQHAPIWKNIQKNSFTYSQFFDICFLVTLFIEEEKYIQLNMSKQASENILQFLIDQANTNLEQQIHKTLQLFIKTASEKQLFDSYVQYLQATNSKRQQQKSIFDKFSDFFKNKKIKKNVFLEILKNEIINNSFMSGQLIKTFTKKKNITSNNEINKQISLINNIKFSIQKQGSYYNNFISAKLLSTNMDTANDICSNESLTKINSCQSQTASNFSISPSEACSIFLYNYKFQQIQQYKNQTEYKKNISQQAYMTNEQIIKILEKYIQLSQSDNNNLQRILDTISKNGLIFLQDLLIIILVHHQQHYDIYPLLKQHIENLTQLFFEGSFQLYDQLVIYFISRIQIMHHPLKHKNLYINDFVQEYTPNSFFHVNDAYIDIETQVINVSQLCQQYCMTFYYINNQKGLYFDQTFCEGLQEIIYQLMQEKYIRIKGTLFQLNLEIMNKNTIQYFSIDFKLRLHPTIKISCLQKYPIVFVFDSSNSALMPLDNFKRLLQNFISFQIYSKKESSNFQILQNKLILDFNYGVQKLKIITSFNDNIITSSKFQHTNWFLKNNKIQKEGKYEVNISLPYQHIFQKIEKLIKIIQLQVIQNAEQEIMFDLIKLFVCNIVIKNKLNIAINQQKSLLFLDDYFAAIEQNSDIEFKIDIS